MLSDGDKSNLGHNRSIRNGENDTVILSVVGVSECGIMFQSVLDRTTWQEAKKCMIISLIRFVSSGGTIWVGQHIDVWRKKPSAQKCPVTEVPLWRNVQMLLSRRRWTKRSSSPADLPGLFLLDTSHILREQSDISVGGISAGIFSVGRVVNLVLGPGTMQLKLDKQ